MKLVAFTDLHEDKKALKGIIEKAKSADFIICAGDISNFGSNLNKMLEILDNSGKQTLIIPGNHESEYELEKLCKKYKNIINIHKSFFRKDNFLFLGYGDSGFSIEDKEFDKVSVKFKKIMKKDDKIILVTHAPVYKTKLDYLPWLKEHRGNNSIRRFIDEVKPMLAICGHFHENFNKVDKINRAIIINPGNHGKTIRIK